MNIKLCIYVCSPGEVFCGFLKLFVVKEGDDGPKQAMKSLNPIKLNMFTWFWKENK